MKKLFLLTTVIFISVSGWAQSCPDNNHPHSIDLGLPSGTKWSCCNVGASKPEEYGEYYAFGETEEREIYDAKSKKGVVFSFTEHTVVLRYDVAYVKWNKSWRTPSPEQMKEFLDNCTSEWTVLNGVNGKRFKGKNGNSVFLPAGGVIMRLSNQSEGKIGHYWSNKEIDDNNAYYLFFYEGGGGQHHGVKAHGRTIRPVKFN